VRLSGSETCGLQHGSDELVIESEHFEQKLTIFNVITFLVPVKLHVVSDQLLVRDIFEDQEI
jgi:hypothetical protein